MRRVLLAVASTTSTVLCIDLLRSSLFFFASEPLVILFPRRFSSPTFASGVVGFLSEICTARLAPLFPPQRRSGQRALSRKRIWKWAKAMVLTRVSLSFCFCSVFHRGIGNAYFITLRYFVGWGLFADPRLASSETLLAASTMIFGEQSWSLTRTSHVLRASN